MATIFPARIHFSTVSGVTEHKAAASPVVSNSLELVGKVGGLMTAIVWSIEFIGFIGSMV